jgi:hypothetical protein
MKIQNKPQIIDFQKEQIILQISKILRQFSIPELFWFSEMIRKVNQNHEESLKPPA